MSSIREQFPAVFAGMEEKDAEAVEAGVMASVFDGWEPTEPAVQRIADRLTGKITHAEFIERSGQQ